MESQGTRDQGTKGPRKQGPRERGTDGQRKHGSVSILDAPEPCAPTELEVASSISSNVKRKRGCPVGGRVCFLGPLFPRSLGPCLLIDFDLPQQAEVGEHLAGAEHD